MLIEKYKPKKLREIVGQISVIRQVTEWLRNWEPGKALLLYGPTGIGKTIIIEVIAKENKWNLFEINASDNRSAKTIKEKLKPIIKQNSLLGERIILIDEVDGLYSSDRGGLPEIIKIIKESAFPVILTANDAYDRKLISLRGYCDLIKMRRIPVNLIEKKLRQINYKESLGLSDKAIREIAQNSNGDLRSAINDLELSKGEIGIRERKIDIFNTLKIIFKTQDLLTALNAINNSEKDIDEIFWWIEENIPNEYEKPEEIAKAFEMLSKADLFKSKIIKNQNYRFKKYMVEMVAGVALAKEKPYRKFVSYKFPAKPRFFKRDENLIELAKQLHCSKKCVSAQMPYLRIIMGM
ncbi:MAG: replication factor C large subunit [Candidatus Aenigmatarchaeota archaeon]